MGKYITRAVWPAVLLALGWIPPASAGEPIEPIAEVPVADFDRLLAEIKPQPGESPWREIPWLTDVTQSRRRAIAEDKPLLIFTAADGSPLGRT